MAVIQPNIFRINSTATQSQVGDVVVKPQTTNTKFYSSKVLNYVESSEVGGYLKTVFYTEVNTNVNVGDRIFILNGNYDSNVFIEQDKYRKYSDGYRVLNIDGCKITLDIDYTGELPYKNSKTGDFIFVHHIKTQEEFDYINSIKISIGGQNILKSIFSGKVVKGYIQLDAHSIIYTSGKFNGSFDPNNLNDGHGGEGFWVRSDTGSQNTWINVSSLVFDGRIKQNPEFSTSGNLYIVGEDFTSNGVTFNQRTSYKYENETWVIDIRYKNPYLSKTNFRFGKFDGTHNDGVFGTYLKKAFWDGAIWNSGSFVYSDWNSGVVNSKHTVEEISYLSKIQDNVVVQTIDFSNNRGFGYNFIEDSLFGMSIINNGNFLNCNFLISSSTFSAIDNYFGLTMSTFNNVNGGKIELCDVYDIKSNGGYFLNSSIYNSNLNKSKLVNSEVVNSALNNGFWSNEGGIKVIGADMWSYDYNPGTILDGTQSDINGTLKLYISEEDYFKLNKGDAFYISKINKDYVLSSLYDDQKILFPLESRYLFESFYDYEILPGVKNLISVSLKSSLENKYKHYIESSKTKLNYFEYVINGQDTSYWYKIPVFIDEQIGPVPQLRFGGWKYNYAINNGYILGDFVYMYNLSDPTILDFYIYWPINKGDVNDNRVGFRAEPGNLTQSQSYGVPYATYSPIDDNGGQYGSDWIFVGTYSNGGTVSYEIFPTGGLWSKDDSYSGFEYPETLIPYIPRTPYGNIVRDNDEDSNFYIFIAGGLGATNSIKSNFIGFDYISENFATQSNISNPSIDITSRLFGWYVDNQDKIILSKNNKISPITPDNVNELFINTILGNGDFKSGIMSNSTWLSGDNSNYYANILSKTIGTNNFEISKLGNNNLKIKMKNNSYLDRTTFTEIAEGYDIKEGDYLWVKSINYNFNGAIISIDGRYKVISGGANVLGSGDNSILEIYLEASDNNSIISTLDPSGTYSTPLGETNNYLSIHKFYLTDSKIISGKFRRTGLNNCVFQNQFFKKYENSGNAIANTELIRLINIMFNRTKNEVKSGVVYKSHFVDDIFNGGTFYNSIWLGGTFSDGLFKSSVWTGGNFNGGRFIDSRESNTYGDFDSTINNKFWQGGNFNGGEFFNSIWIDGIFNNGRFYKSDWFGGLWNNGILGSKTLAVMDTTFAYYGPTSFGATFSIWNNGLVENAMVGGDGVLDWYNGKMVGGEFTSNDTTPQKHSIWHDGEFYGSSFTKKAWWKNGTFLGGKFLSNIGWDKASFLTHSKSITDYGWVDGKFYGGEFGNGSSQSNSVWYGGVMSGGIFQGRFWRDGIFNNGKFYGSLVTQSDISQSLLPFTYSFYGLWNDGKVTSLVSNVKTDEITSTRREVQSTNLSLGKELKKQLNITDMYGVLWKNGTFSNELGSFNNSVWINGEFNLGNFNDSYFNPFVDKSLSGNTYSFTTYSTCVWTGGNFNSGEFNYSKWTGGNFNDGTMNGAIWLDGTFNYGYMNNSYWENGTWRNGIWDGAPFNYTHLDLSNPSQLDVSDFRAKDLLENLRSYSGTTDYRLHLSNVITVNNPQNKIHLFSPAQGFLSWTFSIDGITRNGWVIEVNAGIDGVTTEDKFYNEGNLGSYDFYICDTSITNPKPREIFRSPTGYKIKVEMYVKDQQIGLVTYPQSGFVTLEFKVGNLPSITKSQKTSNNIVVFDFFYQPSQNDLEADNGKSFWFRKVGGGRVEVVDSIVEYGTFTYWDKVNNNVNITTTTSGFSISSIKGVNEKIVTHLGNKNGGLISIKFGNGVFKSGIWKTGVWNDGRRATWDIDQNKTIIATKDDIYYFDSLDSGTYQFSPNKWFIKIVANSNEDNISNIQNNISENDYITIGNITGIDVNEDRYLLKDYYRVTSIESLNQTVILTIEIPVGQFPLRRFEVDSDSHLIYVTKNIWLGGTFLNGYFRGIWSYGLFKGFPFTTVMENSHFIAGKFDGGRFISTKNTIADVNNTIKEYQTGLVQNFEFNDRNISENETFNNLIENKYQSWIDVNYYTQSYVNLNSLTSVYDDDFKKIVPFPNLYGYPTKDVLSSYSKFKNTTDSGIEYYNLGTKYKIYNDFLGDNGYFNKAFSSEGNPGLESFYKAGWLIDEGPFYNTPTASFIYNSNIIKKNFNRLSVIMATFGYNIINNSNINISDKRYSLVEYELEYFWPGKDRFGALTNTFQKPINLLGSNYNSYYNIYDSKTIKTEYFYNKNDLDMVLRFNTEFNVVPPDDSLYMYGFNFTYSVPGVGETNGSYSTTYSIIFAGGTNSYVSSVSEWFSNVTYAKNDIVRKQAFGSEAPGDFYMSLTGSNVGNPITDSTKWFKLSVGFNNGVKEGTILEQSNRILYFTSMRIPYFKFYEIDSLPFFNYFKFEINFFGTAEQSNQLKLIFTKPHGFKDGDQVILKLDETKFNPQYETQSSVKFAKDGIIPPKPGEPDKDSDTEEYFVILNIPYGATVSNLSESGTLTKVTGDRIDRRIQSNYYATSPKIEGLDDNFIYLGSNQVFVDSTTVEGSQTS